ncbi:NAD(+)/NADH kinase [Fusobacterium mortiferum]|uniref:NAD(+)/NADH kinase n=1 Tax=Fusobacterium mortiferum TaxID=850 RepID=UPI0019574317|nr:NAD(+)/NADH kinase [Fusobacterium mortiferum]
MKKVFIMYNKDKLLAQELYRKSVEYFESKGIEIVDKVGKADFGVVIGGDGTLLRAFKSFIFKKNLHVIAINAGSLGFVTEIKKENMLAEYENFLNGEYKYEKRHILEVEVDGKIYYALNEVVLSKAGITSRVLRVNFKTNGEYMCTYKGDGVIVATPTGSTAYSMSAGGPILKSDMKAIVVTPIAPHNLNTRPIVIGGDERIEMRIEDEKRVGQVIIDGQTNKRITSEENIRVEYSKYTLNLVIPRDRNYYSVLREKLKWGDNLC